MIDELIETTSQCGCARDAGEPSCRYRQDRGRDVGHLPRVAQYPEVPASPGSCKEIWAIVTFASCVLV